MGWIKQKPEAEPTRPTNTVVTPTPQATGPTIHRETQQMNNVNIGKSVRIKGELLGNEDLTIEGTVEGKITLKDHTLRIGANGHITADVEAKEVIVAGELNGNVVAITRVEIAATGSMEGDIKSPRLILADGGRFKGGVDMSPQQTGASEMEASPFHANKKAGKTNGGAHKDMTTVAENIKTQ